jgi:hypothetical protein
MVLILLAGVIVGLVFLTKALFAGKVTPNAGAQRKSGRAYAHA